MLVQIQLSQRWHDLSGVIRTRTETYRTDQQAADDIGIGAYTLSRVKNGAVPDLLTFGLIWQWLDMEISGVRVIE